MPNLDRYILRFNGVINTAITVLQLKAGANGGFTILRGQVSQYGSVTSTQEEIALVRKTVGATGTIAVMGTTLFQCDPNSATPNLTLNASGGTLVNATSEGTDGDIPLREGFNILNGWIYIPIPEERIYVPPGGILAMKFLNAPASQTWNISLTIQEQ